MSYGSIYKISFPNGKHYIGLTTSLEQRTKEHKIKAKSRTNIYLYRAIRKYNMVDNIELIEIDTADTKDELCEKEIQYIQEYNSYYMNGNGYNMTYGGEGVNGYVFTEEVKQQMSEAMKKHYKNNPEARQQMSEAQKTRFEKPEARQQMSEALINRYKDNPEARQRASEIAKKRLENPEARRKILDGKGQNKPFDIFTKEGTFIKTFNYQFEAREYLQKEHHITSFIKISEVLSGKRSSSAGLVFKYK